ncbi:MAG: 6-phosphogluconolactonase [Solirubrobacteraceae bacterium]|nr:6-phosphogluconolactonase [Solirubrobacteraceae bacterium]
MKNGEPQLVVVADPAAVASLAAELVLSAVDRALEERGGRCDLALAGGTTPGLLYDELTKQRMDWTGVHLWIGDERCVPHDHPDSNVRLAYERLPAPGAVMHVPPPEGTPEVRAAAYAAQLKNYVLDLVLLGLGEDAHTASLFPDNPGIDDPRPIVPVHDAPKPPPERISLGLGVLSAAKQRIFLVTGAGKRDALKLMLGEPSRHAPSSLLPAAGTTVLADRDAHS